MKICYMNTLEGDKYPLTMSDLLLKFALKTPMPVNRNALIRYITLDKCFRNIGKMYFIEDLVEACNNALKEIDPKSKGVQKRQVQYDIDYMRSEHGFSAPIESYTYDNRKYYRYSDSKFTIHQKLLPHNVVELSKEIVCFLTQFEGLAPLQELYNKLPELKKYYDIKEKEPFVEFDFNFDYQGLKWFTEFFFAIMNNKVLQVDYYSFTKNQQFQFIFHPHYLKEYKHRWYVIGYNENEEKYNWTFGLERIVSIKELPNKIYHPAKENIKDYFYDVIGITKEENKEPQLIQLKVHPDFEKYIVSNPFHPSQKNKKLDENNWRDIELNVIINEELINTLMPYIHFIKIVKPKELLDKIKERIARFEKYNSVETNFFQ